MGVWFLLPGRPGGELVTRTRAAFVSTGRYARPAVLGGVLWWSAGGAGFLLPERQITADLRFRSYEGWHAVSRASRSDPGAARRCKTGRGCSAVLHVSPGNI